MSSMFKVLTGARPLWSGWQIESTTSTPNQTFSVMLNAANPLTINWGDGTSSLYNTTGIVSHTYIDTGSHTMVLNGSASRISFYEGTPTLVTRILNRVNGIYGLTSFQQSFRGCSNLTGSLPERMFFDAPRTTTFAECFQDCTQLGMIPYNILWWNNRATDFYRMFVSCNNMYVQDGAIEVLLSSLSNAITFEDTFRNCTALYGAVPTFVYSPNVISFKGTFNSCPNITLLLPTTFDNCLLVDSFESCFYGNGNMTGTAPELWTRSPVPIDIGVQCFTGCIGLSNYSSIPPATWK